MLRIDESNVLESVLGQPKIKKASYFERISFGCAKKDPFEGKVENDVWKVSGNKLLKKKRVDTNE